MMRRGTLLFWAFAWPVLVAARPFTVLVFNTQNLHDADGVAVYEDQSAERYTPAHALTKVTNIAEVVSRVGDGRGPEIILFQEIEIDQTPPKKPSDPDAVLRRYAGTTIHRMLGE